MPFDEAIAYFKARFPADSAAVDDLVDAYRRNGAVASRLMFDRLAELTRTKLLSALENGDTMADFARSIRQGEASLGIEPATHGYLETAFRTQVQTAYGAGRVRQIESPAVMAARAGVEYRAVGDSRTTNICLGLDGKQWKIDDPEWRNFAPPSHFNCRSAIVTLDDSEIDTRALERRIDVAPAPGFEGSPTDAVD